MVDPVSLQNVVVRSNEVAKVQKVQDERSSLQAQAFSAELQKQTQKAEESVDSHQKTYHYDKDKKKKEENYLKRTKEKKEKQIEKEPPDDSSGHLLDVRA